MTEKRHSKLGIHSAAKEAMPPGHRGQILRRAKLVAFAVLILLCLGALRTVVSRIMGDRALAAATAAHAKQYVTTVQAVPGDAERPLVLPGTLQGYVESIIYARSSGFVLRWNKDIGSRVSKGDLLAEIATPEIDQQLSQAIAARNQSGASLELAKSSFERWESLRQRDAVSQQELDERRSAFDQAKANLASADANVQRLRDVESFKRVVAPYSGVVTRRNVDVGDLVDAGNGGVGKALFGLAQNDPLRVYVFVPQSYSQQIKVGDEATITQAELPGQGFHGKVARTAGAIDTATRTMQIEITLPNHDGKLLPGAYVQVAMRGDSTPNLVVPGNTLLFRAEGPRIAVVDAQGKVQLRPVGIGRDFGRSVEILTGLSTGERLILNPADSLADGDLVNVTQPAAKAPS